MRWCFSSGSARMWNLRASISTMTKIAEIEEQRRDRRHQDHVEVRDLQELGDQERGRAEHRRRDDRAQAARREQSARGFLAVAGLRKQRIRDRAERHRRRDAGARRPAEQERAHHDRAARARGLAAHRGEREVDEELARAGVLQEGAEDREQNDERRRDVDRDAEDAFERHVERAGETRDVVALVRPRRRQVAARRARRRETARTMNGRIHVEVRRFASRISTISATPTTWSIVFGHRRAVAERIAAIEDVGDDRDRREREDDVPPHEAVAEALRHREEQKDQRERERDVHRPQDVRGHDLDGGIQVEHRHDDREQRSSGRRARPGSGSARLLPPR